jgi:hypothetical protein
VQSPRRIDRVSDKPLPPQVLNLIRSAISSVWALDLLLFLKGREGESWTIAQLVREMRGSHPLVVDLVIALSGAGLVEQVGEEFRYAPSRPELRQAVDELARLSAERPLAVRSAILQSPNDKVQVFADAFRLKKD